jgi:hypothetical protein
VPHFRWQHLSPALVSFVFPAFFLASLFSFSTPVFAQQPDPLTAPATPNASKGAYQWGIEMLRFDAAWRLTKGRVHIAAADSGMLEHPELQPGIDGNFRQHMSKYSTTPTTWGGFHAFLTNSVMAARGFNGQGISGACPWCSFTLHEAGDVGGFAGLIRGGIMSGAAAINISLGYPVNRDTPPAVCPAADPAACNALRRAGERDIVVVSIAQNQSNAGAPPDPTVIAVGGLEPDGTFWTHGYNNLNSGSNWGPKLRLVAPAKDVLMLAKVNSYLYNDSSYPCGDRVDSLVATSPSLPMSYSGYGDCTGTSFSGPFVTGLVGLMRSANPLLTAPEVQAILYDTATIPVPGPAGSGLTFYIPDAGAAVQRALGEGNRNRTTPVFSLYSTEHQGHLFTSNPQAALTALAGEFKLPAQTTAATFQSWGNVVSYYPTFFGKLCAPDGSGCTNPEARTLFDVFTTEKSLSPTNKLVPLYRMSQVCAANGPAPTDGCKPVRTFAYATQRSQVTALEARGFVVDMVEGYIYSPDQVPPIGSKKLCLAFDNVRIDHILYAADECDQTQLWNENGQNTGGSYQFAAMLGYAPGPEPSETNQAKKR